MGSEKVLDGGRPRDAMTATTAGRVVVEGLAARERKVVCDRRDEVEALWVYRAPTAYPLCG